MRHGQAADTKYRGERCVAASTIASSSHLTLRSYGSNLTRTHAYFSRSSASIPPRISGNLPPIEHCQVASCACFLGGRWQRNHPGNAGVFPVSDSFDGAALESWEIIAPLMPLAKPGGSRRTGDIRTVLNAIFYSLRSGGAWRRLPQDSPEWQTVYTYFRDWRKDDT